MAFSSYPYPIDKLKSVCSYNDFPFSLPIFSTSVVGSTPGNSTKNTGVIQLVIANVSFILKGFYSIYFSPKYFATKIPKAEETLSGLIILITINL